MVFVVTAVGALECHHVCKGQCPQLDHQKTVEYLMFSIRLQSSCFHQNLEEVASAIRSFPQGSLGGPDGIHPQHLLDLTNASAEHGGRSLLRALTAFANCILQGDVPHSVKAVFFRATLISLRKKEGGICPIAVGLTLHRLVAKCVTSRVKQYVGSRLALPAVGLQCSMKSTEVQTLGTI